MHNRIIFKESSGKPTKGEWTKVFDENGVVSAILACPDCGGLMTILKHKIHSDGDVCPSVVAPQVECPRPCDFHAYVKLDGWGN